MKETSADKIYFFQKTTNSKIENEWLDSINIPKECRQVKIELLNKYYIVDAYDPDTNTVYEFYGDYWHGNPKVYNPYTINKKANKTFIKLYNLTIEKEKFLKQAGYRVISIWESDWRKIKNEQDQSY